MQLSVVRLGCMQANRAAILHDNVADWRQVLINLAKPRRFAFAGYALAW